MFNMKEIFADEDVMKSRLAICEECPKYIKVSKQCKVCLCVMPLKTRFAATECPIGKWNRIHPNTNK